MIRTLTIRTITRIGKSALRLAKTFPEYRRGERVLQGVVLGLLEGTVGKMGQEKNTTWGRVDFRHGGTNPVLIELAIRDPYHANELYGGQNRDELNKLCRIPYKRAKLRCLLLLDASGLDPIPKRRLKASYDKVSSTPGRFERSAVRVVYVHHDVSYHFLWRSST